MAHNLAPPADDFSSSSTSSSSSSSSDSEADEIPRLQSDIDLNAPPADAKDSSKDPKKNQKFTESSYKCWCCLGVMGLCGMHRCYLRNTCVASQMLFTCGYCGYGQCKDYKYRDLLLEEANAGRLQTECDQKCCCVWRVLCIVVLVATSCVWFRFPLRVHATLKLLLPSPSWPTIVL